MPISNRDRHNPFEGTSEGSEPVIDPKTLQADRRALKDAKEAFNLFTTLRDESKDRNLKNARIMAKYNAEAPYKQSDLKAEGLDWKANFSTKPLAVLIDKVGPRFTKAVHTAKYLTASELPDTIVGAPQKTEAFRRKITKAIRSWKGWKPFLAELAQENALFGYAGACWTDEYEWQPTFYRQDEFFVPKGAKQTADSIQVLCLRETYLIHELFKLIADREAAQTAGWNVENAVKAINDAKPDDTSSSTTSSDARRHEDMIRETSTYTSYAKGAKVIVLAHVLAVEHTGRVSHYILNERNGDELFFREDRFGSMQEVFSPFTFQQANGTIHGSKGIGREVYNIASAVDRARNEVIDRLQLSGKMIIRSDEKSIRKFSMTVVGGAVVIDKAYDVSEQTVKADTAAFYELDKYMVALMDEIAGSTTPREFAGERVTKAAVDLYASREEEKRDVLIERFLLQVGDLVTEMQRRMCSPNVTDQAAQALRAEFLEIMSEQELEYLANQPAIQTVEDFTQQKTQELILFAESKKGNPVYNQRKLEYRSTAARFGDEFANDVILPDADPTELAEQTNQQILENVALMQGEAVPVSPRDNARMHLDALAPKLAQLAQGLVTNPEAVIPIIGAFIQHAQDHINTAIQAGAKPAEFADDVKGLTELAKQVGESQGQLEAAAALGGGQPQPQGALPA